MIASKTTVPTTGSLADIPLAELLVRLDLEAFSGSLEISVGNRGHLAVLLGGKLVKAQLAVPVEPLGRILIERGLVDAVRLDRLLARQPATGRRLGRLLIDEGLINAAQLEQALGEQVRRRIVRLFLAGDGTFRLYPDGDLLEGRGGLDSPLDPLALLPEGVRNGTSPEELESRLVQALSGRIATVAASETWERLGFNPAETSACRYLARGPWDASVFGAVPAAHKHTLLVAAYCLWVAGLVTISSPSADLAPLRPSAADEALRKEILAVHAGLHARSHFELLGVPEDVSDADLKARYLELVKQYHPDRAVRHGLQEYKQELEDILLHVREAYETLLDPATREQYLAKSSGDPAAAVAEAQEVVDRAVGAERGYQLAVVLERQHKLEEAQKSADEAVRLAPGQGEYLCMSLWLQAARRPARASIDDLVPAMLEAAATAAKNERAQMQAGRLLQRAGRGGEAIAHFQLVLQVNPQNVDAAREVRLGAMRYAKQSIQPAGGLFGKFFGRKDKDK